jgi:hypothetical protein
MNRVVFGVFGVMAGLAAAVIVTTGSALAREQVSNTNDSPAACTQMMRDAGATEEGTKAMHDFMQSDRAPQAMANRMEMARRMGTATSCSA